MKIFILFLIIVPWILGHKVSTNKDDFMRQIRSAPDDKDLQITQSVQQLLAGNIKNAISTFRKIPLFQDDIDSIISQIVSSTYSPDRLRISQIFQFFRGLNSTCHLHAYPALYKKLAGEIAPSSLINEGVEALDFPSPFLLTFVTELRSSMDADEFFDLSQVERDSLSALYSQLLISAEIILLNLISFISNEKGYFYLGVELFADFFQELDPYLDIVVKAAYAGRRDRVYRIVYFVTRLPENSVWNSRLQILLILLQEMEKRGHLYDDSLAVAAIVGQINKNEYGSVPDEFRETLDNIIEIIPKLFVFLAKNQICELKNIEYNEYMYASEYNEHKENGIRIWGLVNTLKKKNIRVRNGDWEIIPVIFTTEIRFRINNTSFNEELFAGNGIDEDRREVKTALWSPFPFAWNNWKFSSNPDKNALAIENYVYKEYLYASIVLKDPLRRGVYTWSKGIASNQFYWRFVCS